MTMEQEPSGYLTLGHVLAASGITDPSQVMAIRHTPKDTGFDLATATPEAVHAATRFQNAKPTAFPKVPPPLWLVFLADGGLRSRFYTAYSCAGESMKEQTDTLRFFDIYESPELALLRKRLVVMWPGAVRSNRSAQSATQLAVVEIADPVVKPFEGYDRVCWSYPELRSRVFDYPYARVQEALGAVSAVYLIADTTNGRLYVGSATSKVGGLLGRWRGYATDGHGDNKELKALAKGHTEQFQFSILQVFSPQTLENDVYKAESHWKQALQSRVPALGGFGYNAN